MFSVERMSRSPADLAALQLAGHIGLLIADARREKRWTLRQLADRTSLAASSLHAIEHGRPATLASYAAIATALGLNLRLDLVDPRLRARTVRAEDPVHAAMGEIFAERLSGPLADVSIDEPFQHFQFAGRADVLVIDRASRSLLHIENRTRFPNLQEAAGSYNVKRRYLAGVIVERIGLRQGFESVSHVMVGLWSAEVMHDVRLRPATFRSICPDGPDAFEAWWSGSRPAPSRPTSAFVLLDPCVSGSDRRRPFVGLEAALTPTLRPRYRGYANAAAALRAFGKA